MKKRKLRPSVEGFLLAVTFVLFMFAVPDTFNGGIVDLLVYESIILSLIATNCYVLNKYGRIFGDR